MIAPYDASGNLCGFNDSGNDMTLYPKLYFSDITKMDINVIFSSGICVKTCPGQTEINDASWS